MTNVVCLTCGKTFNVYPYRLAKGEGIYCSRECVPRNIIVPCVQCGQMFKAQPSALKNGKAKYCTLKCAVVARQKPKIETCRVCGKQFVAFSRGLTKYCSRECFKNQRKTLKIRCPTCNKYFETSPSEAKRGGGKYCSPRCYHDSRVVKEKTKCLNCGKDFEVSTTLKKKGKGKFCSTSCGKEGEFNPSFNGWSSFEPYCPKFNKGFKSRVRAFYDFKCIICGKSTVEEGKALSVHHVDYDKNVCCNNKPPMFACVCNSHNAMANHDRVRWSYIFHRIIDELFDGKCYYSKEEYFKLKE